LDEYLVFDDWEINYALKQKQAGSHGDILLNRKHFKCLHTSQPMPTPEDEAEISRLKQEYDGKPYHLDDRASTSWYKLDKDIVIFDGKKKKTMPLSEKSTIVKSISDKTAQKRFYAAG